MSKRIAFWALVIAVPFVFTLTASADSATWTGEVIDVGCYVTSDAKGADHAGCAKACVENGQPMGLLTAEGSLVLLTADHKDGSAYEALKDLAGAQAEVTGTLAEKDGVKVVTVTGSKAAG